jgi:hypothetical protein
MKMSENSKHGQNVETGGKIYFVNKITSKDPRFEFPKKANFSTNRQKLKRK